MSMLRTLPRLAFAVALVLSLVALGDHAGAQARPYQVIGGSRIQFVSDAPLERITGVSSTLRGQVSIDPQNVAATRGRIEVPIASLRTGMDLRDDHLRGSGWLDAARFPSATFEITGVEGATALRAGEVARVTLVGRFTIHGVTRDLRAEAQVRWMPASAELAQQGVRGDLVRAQASFTVSLPQHGISVNALFRLKVSDQIRVNVTLRASNG